MRNRYFPLGFALLSLTLHVAARPLPTPLADNHLDDATGDDGWPRVVGGRGGKGCQAGVPKKPTQALATAYEEETVVDFVTVTETVSSLVIVTEYADVTVSLIASLAGGIALIHICYLARSYCAHSKCSSPYSGRHHSSVF